jgi:quercetin dioxygenase-like cupin family protein
MRTTLQMFVALALVGAIGWCTGPSVPAQEATPAGEMEPLTIEILGDAPSPDAPGMTLVLLRATLAPGAALPPHIHPGQLVIAVESGTAGYAIVSPEGQSERGRFGTPTASEVIASGPEVLLGPGEWIVEQPGIVHTARNAGEEPLVLLISGLVTAGEPFVQLVETEMATPVP